MGGVRGRSGCRARGAGASRVRGGGAAARSVVLGTARSSFAMRGDLSTAAVHRSPHDANRQAAGRWSTVAREDDRRRPLGSAGAGRRLGWLAPARRRRVGSRMPPPCPCLATPRAQDARIAGLCQRLASRPNGVGRLDHARGADGSPPPTALNRLLHNARGRALRQNAGHDDAGSAAGVAAGRGGEARRPPAPRSARAADEAGPSCPGVVL
jgi:hypothetical protein